MRYEPTNPWAIAFSAAVLGLFVVVFPLATVLPWGWLGGVLLVAWWFVIMACGVKMGESTPPARPGRDD